MNTLLFAGGGFLLLTGIILWTWWGIEDIEINNTSLWPFAVVLTFISLFIFIYGGAKWLDNGQHQIEYELINSGIKFVRDTDSAYRLPYNVKMIHKVIEVEDGADYEYWEIVE